MKVTVWDGKTITRPGIYSGIPLAVYHDARICDGPSTSSSGLRKIFMESPAHYWIESPLNPNRLELAKEPKHFILGRAAHHLMLGEPHFAKSFAVQPPEYETENGELKPWHNGAIVCREWQQAMRAAGRAVFTPDDADVIKGMVRSLEAHPLIRKPVSCLNGLIEHSLFWKDKKTGIWLKSRPDTIPGNSGDFVDLKTCDSVQKNDLVRSLGKFGYHQQGAMVREGAGQVLGIEASFTLVWVEKSPPYCVRVTQVKTEELDRGARANRAALDLLARCLRTEKWPGPGGDANDAEYIELSEREQRNIDDQLTIMNDEEAKYERDRNSRAKKRRVA